MTQNRVEAPQKIIDGGRFYTRIRMYFYESFARSVYVYTTYFFSESTKILIASATEICTPNLILVHAGNKSSIILMKHHSVQRAFHKNAKIIFF